MSEVKKDDHGEKKSLPVRLLAKGLILGAIILAAIWFGVGIPMLVDVSGEGIGNTGKAFIRFAAHENILAEGMGSSAEGFRAIGKEAIKWAVTILVVFFILKIIYGAIFSKKKDDGHESHEKPVAKKDEKKPDAVKAETPKVP